MFTACGLSSATTEIERARWAHRHSRRHCLRRDRGNHPATNPDDTEPCGRHHHRHRHRHRSQLHPLGAKNDPSPAAMHPGYGASSCLSCCRVWQSPCPSCSASHISSPVLLTGLPNSAVTRSQDGFRPTESTSAKLASAFWSFRAARLGERAPCSGRRSRPKVLCRCRDRGCCSILDGRANPHRIPSRQVSPHRVRWLVDRHSDQSRAEDTSRAAALVRAAG